jgi:hypothetical protein
MSNKKISRKASLGSLDSIDSLETESFVDDEGVFFEEELTGTDKEPEAELDSDISVHEYVEDFIEGEGGIDDMQDTLEYIEEDLLDVDEAHGDEPLPGSFMTESETEDGEEEVETDYANDGDLSKFMDYVYQVYPANIPQHDGDSMSGCERAVSFLDKLNSEMSRAVRDDSDSSIDLSMLEDVRLNVMKDIMVLKNHLGKLKKKFKDSHKKNATQDATIKEAGRGKTPTWLSRSGEEIEYTELTKEASTPNNMVIAITAFERAISGIMINAHVSAGNDMEEVYEFLNKKYDITPREELSIMQVVADSGHHIFKDRGTYGHDESKSKDSNNRGVDFIKNYFA